MKAMGNFTVDFNWADGKVQKATIVSNAGAELRVRCARGANKISTVKVSVDGVEIGFWVDEHDIATIPCEKGSVVEIDFNAQGTKITTQKAEKKSEKIYGLDGRTINEMQSETVYIIDGKKILNK